MQSGDAPQPVATIVVLMFADGNIGWQIEGAANKVIALGMLAQAAQGIALPQHEHAPPVPKLDIVRSMPSNGF
jgi:hypothetical protein